MKIMPLLFLFVAIQLSLSLFSMTSYDCSGGGGDYNDTGNTCFDVNGEYVNYTIGNETFGNNDIWDGLINSWKGGDSKFIMALLGFALLIGAVGFYPFTNRSDISLLSMPFAFILMSPMVTIVNLYSFVSSQVGSFACEVTTSCFISQLFGILFAGTLLLAWGSACLEWWTGRQMG